MGRPERQAKRRQRRDESRRQRQAWVAKARIEPKETMEADLVIAAVGLIVIVLGGLVAVAGVHPKWQSIHNNSPAPLLGNIMAGFGLLIVAVGVILLLVNTVIWISRRMRRRSE